jgi:hypothetical protein
MLARKLTASIAVLAATAVAAPAFADNGRHNGHRGHYRPAVQHYHVQHRPVVRHVPVVHHYYRPAPRPVVVYHQPAPVVHYSHPNNGAALLVGAVLGAAIVHTVISGY